MRHVAAYQSRQSLAATDYIRSSGILSLVAHRLAVHPFFPPATLGAVCREVSPLQIEEALLRTIDHDAGCTASLDHDACLLTQDRVHHLLAHLEQCRYLFSHAVHVERGPMPYAPMAYALCCAWPQASSTGLFLPNRTYRAQFGPHRPPEASILQPMSSNPQSSRHPNFQNVALQIV